LRSRRVLDALERLTGPHIMRNAEDVSKHGATSNTPAWNVDRLTRKLDVYDIRSKGTRV